LYLSLGHFCFTKWEDGNEGPTIKINMWFLPLWVGSCCLSFDQKADPLVDMWLWFCQICRVLIDPLAVFIFEALFVEIVYVYFYILLNIKSIFSCGKKCTRILLCIYFYNILVIFKYYIDFIHIKSFYIYFIIYIIF
jgi:hypothetical protein